LSSFESTQAVAKAVISQVGNPTVLINNAGVGHGKTVLQSTEKDIEFTFKVNTLSHFWLTREFLPSIVRNDHGMIVTVSSTSAYIPVSNMVDYGASKAASVAFHEGLANEILHRYQAPRVRTVLVTQGYTKTPFFAGFNNDSIFLNPSLEPGTVADAIVNKVLTGTSGHLVLPGFSNLLTALRAAPNWLQILIRGHAQRMMLGYRGRRVSHTRDSIIRG
jgi:all-trans-retinol dehydrogenase (NAD+)